MDNITICLKPDWVSWNEIQECQKRAHEINLSMGIDMICAHYSGKELKNRIDNGVCFVALDGKKVVGTCSYNYNKTSRWWCRGRVAYLCMAGVLPEYQGKHIYSRLCRMREEHILSDDSIDTIWLHTAESNVKLQRIALSQGFRRVQLSFSAPGSTYYSVVMAKWLKNKLLPDYIVDFLYYATVIVVKLIWKPGGKRRFGI